MTVEPGPRTFALKGHWFGVLKGTPVSAPQAKLVGVAQPDRARLTGFWTSTLRSALEAPGVVSGLADLALERKVLEQRGSHPTIAEDGVAFAECQNGGDDGASALVA